jgi:hypothetical protein
MTPYQWILLAGALGTFVIIYQNWLSFRDTQVEIEDRLRERLTGRGNGEGRVVVSVDEIRVRPLSRGQKLKWYLGWGINSEVEVKLETNAVISDEMWNALEEVLGQDDIDLVSFEHLQTNKSPQNQTGLSTLRINSVDESEIMEVVCGIPVAINSLDPEISFESEVSLSLYDMPDEYEDMLTEIV